MHSRRSGHDNSQEAPINTLHSCVHEHVVRSSQSSTKTTPPGAAMRGGIAPTKIIIKEDAALVDAVVAQCAQKWNISDADLRQALYEACQRGDIVDSNNHRLCATSKLNKGQVIYLHRSAADETPLPQLQVLWRGDHAMIVNKPAVLSTIPRGSYIARSVVVAARRQFRNDNIVAAHRLDRLTTGCLLLVTSPHYRRSYQMLFQEGYIEKQYQAITHTTSANAGDTCEVGATFQWNLGMCKPTQSLKVYVDRHEKTVDTVTCARIVALCNRHIHWCLEPKTGFTHQLRAALCHHGTPIVGDPLYPQILKLDHPYNTHPQMALHAKHIFFQDPITSRNISVEAPLPQWWSALCKNS
ncbi:MAG: pseudouridine synthase [Actinomycetaceae bacterium]|nr:pseudouridine synthase [Actinomycetaceae bacterium]